DEIAEASAGLRSQLIAVEQRGSSEQQRLLRRPGMAVHRRDRLVAEAALGRVDHPLERQVVRRRLNQAQVGDRVADLRTLVETEAADDLVWQADRDEALFELAGLELGAHEDRGLVQGPRSE